MLSKRWNVAVEAGVGLYRTKDTRRDPTVGDWDDKYIYITAAGRSRRQNWKSHSLISFSHEDMQ